MRRLLAIAVPAVLLLGAPVSAPAKGIMGATVCGVDGCKTVERVDEGLLGGGAATSPPSAREPFVRLEFRVGVPGHTERVRQLFVPRPSSSSARTASGGHRWRWPRCRRSRGA